MLTTTSRHARPYLLEPACTRCAEPTGGQIQSRPALALALPFTLPFFFALPARRVEVEVVGRRALLALAFALSALPPLALVIEVVVKWVIVVPIVSLAFPFTLTLLALALVMKGWRLIPIIVEGLSLFLCLFLCPFPWGCRSSHRSRRTGPSCLCPFLSSCPSLRRARGTHRRTRRSPSP